MKTAIIIALLLISSICSAAQYQAEVIGPWVIKSSGLKVSPVSAAYRGCMDSDAVGRADKSGELAEPNLGIWTVQCDNETITKMETDGLKVLWTSKVQDALGVGEKSISTATEKPNLADLEKLKADLKAVGITDTNLEKTALRNTSKADLTRYELSRQLAEAFKELPAKTGQRF
jgi:hypothetical protein